VKVVDLVPGNEPLFFVCLEEWSDEMREAGDHKERWYRRMADRGLRVKFAVDDHGTVGGMIQYVPIEASPAQGTDLYFVHCIWVHGHPQGRGNFQGHGMGKALLRAAEEDVRAMGRKGLAAWGIPEPFWMPAAWYEAQGYEIADRDGFQILVWKSFSEDAKPPTWIRRTRTPAGVPGRVTVTAFRNGWCPSANVAFERARRAAGSVGEPIAFEAVDTSDRDTFLAWGIADGLFVDDQEIVLGPPPSQEAIEQAIRARLRAGGGPSSGG